MSTKIGVHVQHAMDVPAQKEFARKTQYPVGKIMEDNLRLLDECKEVNPDCFWAGRVHWEPHQQDVSNPYEAALMLRDRILRQAMCYKVDAWEGFNEPNQWDHMRQAEFECHAAQLLAAEELKYIAFSWSVGNPRLEIWHGSVMLEALRLAAYLGLHEYDAPTLWNHYAFDPPYTDREAYLTSGWWCLRYRKVWEIIAQYLAPHERPEILITEFGIDSGAPHVDPGAQGGWKSFYGREEYPALFEQIDWYDRQILRDPYVKGATWFTFGTRDKINWGTFDFFEPESARSALAEYLASRIDPVDLFTLIGDHLNDTEIMIPANPEAAFQQYAWVHGLGAARTKEVGYHNEFLHEGKQHLAQMFMRDDDLTVQHIVYADVDDPRPWSEKTGHFDRPN